MGLVLNENKKVIWGIGLALTALCCLAIVGFGVLQTLLLFNDAALASLVTGPTNTLTPIPVIVRTPVATVPPPATQPTPPTTTATTALTQTNSQASSPTPTP